MNISFDITVDNVEKMVGIIAESFGYDVVLTKKQEQQEEVPEVIEGDAPQEDVVEDAPVEKVFETEVTYGVNLRTAPNLDQETRIYRMLPKGEKIRVIQQVDANWLEVETQDGYVGFISSNQRYTDYVSKEDRDKKIDQLFAYGETFLEAPYVFGAKIGEKNSFGDRVFDCSSFTKTIFQNILGVTLPRVSYNQATTGQEVLKEDLQRGDLMFFTSRGLEIGHVGVYAGNDQILHTYGTGGVRYTGFTGTQWEERFAIAKRVY